MQHVSGYQEVVVNDNTYDSFSSARRGTDTDVAVVDGESLLIVPRAMLTGAEESTDDSRAS